MLATVKLDMAGAPKRGECASDAKNDRSFS